MKVSAFSSGSVGSSCAESRALSVGPVRVAAAAAVLAAAALTASGGTPRGPSFGTTRYRTEIRNRTDPDLDDYVARLVAGESLSVGVAAERGSDLRPTVRVLDATGAERTPPLVERKDGASVSFARLPIDVSGPWTVRVAGRGTTQGRYAVRFSVRPPPAGRIRGASVGDDGVLERVHAFEAVEGCRLDVKLRRRSGSRSLVLAAVTDPAGNAAGLGDARRAGTSVARRNVALAGGDGAWAATVSLEEGSARYDLLLRVHPPPRPRGTFVLSPDEPRMPVRVVPIDGRAGLPLTLTGAAFSAKPPPEVWFGPRRAVVVSAEPSRLRVVPPDAEDGAVVEVAVVNPDGQADVHDAYFRYADPAPARLSRIDPALVSVWAGRTQPMTLRLDRPAGWTGARVDLATAGSIGTVPASVVLVGEERSATFDFAATPLAPGGPTVEGTVVATLGDRTLVARVTVVPLPDPGGGGDEEEPPPPLPDEIDVSSWTVVQANSARTFSIPPGTRLVEGDVVVIARDAPRAAFEAFWGVTLGENVRYLVGAGKPGDSGDDWPSVNGDETFTLKDAQGNDVDGPTFALQVGGGQAILRAAGLPPGQAASWTISNLPKTDATPGRVAPASGRHGVFVSEVADPSGSGNYVYEFVELHFDGHAGPE